MSATLHARDIDRLAEQAGLEPTYRDFYGEDRRVAPETKRAFLGALGFDVSSEESIAAAVRANEEAGWRCLDPVVVVREGASALRTPVVFPSGTLKIGWTLVEELGRTTRGTLNFLDLSPLGVTEIGGRLLDRRVFELPVPTALGYHRLALTNEDGAEVARTTVVVAPTRCYVPPAIERGAKVWGLAVQLYGLRSKRNWGIGDFTDLRSVVETAAAAGAATIGLNPLHALDPENPAAASPYGPSSRLFLNVIYLDPQAIPDFAESDEARAYVFDPRTREALARLRRAPLVDYPAVMHHKRHVLELLYASFRRRHAGEDDPQRIAFRAFRTREGRELERLATYEMLREHFAQAGVPGYGWTSWPQAYHDAAGPAVAALAAERADRIAFFAWLQWHADLQLAQAAQAARGMELGIYRDLAVGASSDGCDAWGDREALLSGVTVGAPPDPLNVRGQNWGLAPTNPLALRERGFAPFIALLRANMRHSGALRIDHVMGLARLFWIPQGRDAADGAYVRYPLADLLAIMALESQRHRCLIIGEDLGTVPEGLRERLQWERVFSYRLLTFEREPDGGFIAPDRYPAFALASGGTHDLPTFPAFWTGEDIDLRVRLGLLGPGQSRPELATARAHDRDELLRALEREGDVSSADIARLHETDAARVKGDLMDTLARGAYRYLARSPARLLIAPIEDVLGETAQLNVPGTVDQYPNWRRKLGTTVEALATSRRLGAFAVALRDVRALPSPPTVPTATYRLQFHKGFTFVDAERLVPYLAALGISHVYASPIMQARAGSTHGYDITDHNAINPEIGTRAEFERLVGALHKAGLGLVLDFVPNHMGVGDENPWWFDVLMWGRNSPYATFFDIDWQPSKRELRDKVLLPFLGDSYGAVLERGELVPAFEAASGLYVVTYFEKRFPIVPTMHADLLAPGIEAARRAELPAETLSALDAALAAYRELAGASRSAFRRAGLRERAAELARELAEIARTPGVGAALNAGIAPLRVDPEKRGSWKPLLRLLDAQSYRPAYWRVALDEINYRRFFDVNDLAGLRIEVAECFAVVHQLAFKMLAAGQIQGLRIDHVDGLFDPAGYCNLLRADASSEDHPLYLVVEKILAKHERLREDWGTNGTTGYEFAGLVNAVFVDGENEMRIDRLYRSFSGELRPFDEVLLECKHLIMEVYLTSELNVLASELERLAQADVRSSDFTWNGLRTAIKNVVAAFPVYRTYVTGGAPAPEDRRDIEWAVGRARKRATGPDTSVYDFIASILTTDAVRVAEPRYPRRAVLHFAMKFQQYTSPVMAKSLEDTSFYRYVRLASLNEVGGDPRRFGMSPAAFHRAMRERAAATPFAGSATSTHDTKRSEDVRARIDVLSELPSAWRRMLLRCERQNRRLKRETDGRLAPDRNDEYLLYQTLLGAWPIEALEPAAIGSPELEAFRERIEAYQLKAMREAKRNTSWSNPDEAYEDAMREFVRGIFATAPDAPFWTEFLRFARVVASYGAINGLAQVAIKATAPGVPDFYQGTELWDFSLVDPDNRRPVDYGLRERTARELAAREASPAYARELLHDWRDGRVKLWTTQRLARLRQEHREAFLSGRYAGLEAAGTHADSLLAYVSGDAIVLVPRLVARLCPDATVAPIGAIWTGTTLAVPKQARGRRYVDALTGRTIDVGDAPLDVAAVLADFPIAVLTPRLDPIRLGGTS